MGKFASFEGVLTLIEVLLGILVCCQFIDEEKEINRVSCASICFLATVLMYANKWVSNALFSSLAWLMVIFFLMVCFRIWLKLSLKKRQHSCFVSIG